MKIEINFDDLISDMFDGQVIDEYGCIEPSMSFKESLRSEIVRSISSTILKQIKDASMKSALELANGEAQNFIDNELNTILIEKLTSGELKTGVNGFESFDALISARLARFNVDKVICDHIDRKSKEFALEMKSRYDNVFAAKIVQSLSLQKMLNPDVAKMLLGE